MKRVVVAALVVAGVGLGIFSAPADGATGHAGTMIGQSAATYKFSKGICPNGSGNGSFNIEVGDSVTWTNCSNAGHTVTGEAFGSADVISPGDSSPMYTFNSPGTFTYRCDIHPTTMTGAVNVTGTPATTTPTPTAPATTATTTPPATTSTTRTVASTTTTTDRFDDVFTPDPTSSTTSTTVDPTVTTRALGTGGDSGTSAGAVGLLVLGLGTVGTAAALLIRRLRGGPVPPS